MLPAARQGLRITIFKSRLFHVCKSADLSLKIRRSLSRRWLLNFRSCVGSRVIRNIKFFPLSVPVFLKPKHSAKGTETLINTSSTTNDGAVAEWGIFRLFNFVKLTLRVLMIWCIVIQLLILYPCCRLHLNLKDFWWRLVLRAIEFSGPIFVKFGQWASTRRDIFPVEMCDRLTLLQHRRSPHSWSKTVAVLDNEFGKEWREVFIFDGPQSPIGSGCVAQVYKMYMKPHIEAVPTTCINILTATGICKDVIYSNLQDPIPVALKVLHPKIHQHFKRDTVILNHMAASIQFICPWLKWISLIECVGEFCQFMLSQIDLEKEASYLERFSENFSDDYYIRFPRPIYPYVTKNVLVETWEEGEHIGKYLNTKDAALRKKLSEILVNCLLQMTFSDNLVHGDLHPGNILVHTSISEECTSTAVLDDIGDMAVLNFVNQLETKRSLRVVILDCGLSTALSTKDFDNFSSVFKAIVLGQGDEVGRLFLKHCINECEHPEKFVQGMADLVAKFRQNTLSLQVVDVGKLFGSLFDIMTKHKVKLESNFSSIMMAIIIVEGLGRSLDPEKDLMRDARRYLLNQ